MSLVIHANIRVTGDKDQLESFREQVSALLAEEGIIGDVEERHTEAELVFDLKVKGGIPFPQFVMASSQHPGVVVEAEWVNPEAGMRGTATIKQGALTEQKTETLETKGASLSGENEYIAVSGTGKLLLALTFSRISRDEYLGYAITAGEDAMFGIKRKAEGPIAELTATAGNEPGWHERWLINLAEQTSEYAEFQPPQPIADTVYRELEKMAKDFAETWIWFSSSPKEEIIIEIQKYEQRGYPVNEANVKTEKLRKMEKKSANVAEIFEHSTLTKDNFWVKELIEQCWAEA